MQKSRITNLSTRYLSLYKNGVWAILGALVVGLILQVVIARDFFLVVYAFLVATIASRNSKVFHIEFDDEYLYLMQKNADVLIPLQNIKDVELKTLGGLYEITLFYPESVGDKLYYKPSLLYPFNFKAKDRIADILREKIERAKRKPEILNKKTLTS